MNIISVKLLNENSWHINLKKSFRANPLALLKTMKSFQCSMLKMKKKKKPCKTHINKAII